jgi:hypothetical protein
MLGIRLGGRSRGGRIDFKRGRGSRGKGKAVGVSYVGGFPGKGGSGIGEEKALLSEVKRGDELCIFEARSVYHTKSTNKITN